MMPRGSIPVLGTLFGKRTLLPVWMGALVLSGAWLRALWIYAPPVSSTLWFAAGLALLVIGCRGGEPGPRRLRGSMAVLLAVASITGVLFLPRPYNFGPGVLLAAAILALVPVPGWLRRALLPGLWTTGVVLVLQAAMIPVLFIVAARLHDAPFLTPFVYAPLKLLAPGTVRTGATLQMLTSVDAISLTPSWDKLALIPAALVATAFVTIVLLLPRGPRRLPSLVLFSLLYAWVRLVFLFLIVSRYHAPRVFWDVDALGLSFVPWGIVVAAWWSWGVHRDAAAGAALPAGAPEHDAGGGAGDKAAGSAGSDAARFGWQAALAAFLCVGGFTLFWGYQDPGRPKAGRILIDEGHSDWEWTTQVFDQKWYGGKSGYNYYCLADYWNHFYTVETHREPLTPALLSQWDVLVIKTPTSAYTEAEVDAIVDFVRNGGGLFLVGDHTNVFGSSTYLNPIAERFRLYFRYDATYRLDNLDLSRWHPPAVLPHAIVRNMRDFLFATSCSLDAPLLSENVILGYGLRGIYLDYSETSYFPTKPDKMDDMYPLLVQAGGVRFGKGRVLGFTDSTVFSNFFMFIPGKAELALGAADWLNRTNRHGFLRGLALLAGFAGLGLWLWELRRRERITGYGTFVPVGLAVFVLTANACERWAARDYATPQPVRGMQEIVFDGEHGNFTLPLTSLLSDHWTNMHTFYVWMQRPGFVPRWVSRLNDALQYPGRVLVEINPARDYTLGEIDGIVDFVRRGGVLLVLDTPLNQGAIVNPLARGQNPEARVPAAAANQLLGPFSMRFVAARRDSQAVLRPPPPGGDWLTGPVPGDTLAVGMKAFGVTGATPLLTLSDSTTVLGVRDFGKGKVIACGASTLFSTSVMGSTAVTPHPRLRALYQVQYDLLERIAHLQVRGRYAQADSSR